MIEELGERLTNDDLSVTYQRATDRLADSRDQATLLRLCTAASRALFLTGVSPAPPDWKEVSLTKAVSRYERSLIERALKESGGMVTRAARLLG
jgi:transcriptional regulator with GAF, ATPase, and Fis domain